MVNKVTMILTPSPLRKIAIRNLRSLLSEKRFMKKTVIMTARIINTLPGEKNETNPRTAPKTMEI